MQRLVVRFILAMLEKMGVGKWIEYAILRPIIIASERFLINIESNIAAQINKWVSGGIVADGIYEIFEVVIKKYIERLIGKSLDNIDRETVLTALGEFASELAQIELKKRYDIDVPIKPMYPVDKFLENLGYVMASVANNKIGSHVFSTFLPPNNLKQEIDAWLLNELVVSTGIQLSTIFDKDLIKKIRQEALGMIVDTLKSHLASISQNAVQQLLAGDAAAYSNLTFTVRREFIKDGIRYLGYEEVTLSNREQIRAFNVAVLDRFTNQLEIFCSNQIKDLVQNGFENFDVVPASMYTMKQLTSNYGIYNAKTNRLESRNGLASMDIQKQKNRARQARFRLTHKENRTWVHK